MKRRPLAITALLATFVAAVSCVIFARPLSVKIAQRWGPAIVRAGDGKFSDASIFVQHRINEGAWLLALLVGLSVLGGMLAAASVRRFSPLWKWVAYSVLGFIALNVWIKAAAATPLFWCVFWNGKGTTDNLTQFHIKLLLMDENRAPTKIVLAGSSQVRTEIDARLLNSRFGSNFFTTELHFPGNHAFDFLFLDRKLQGRRVDAIVCYLSEANFYVGGVSDGFQLFFTFRDLPDYFHLGGRHEWSPGSLGNGLLSDVTPLFWLREPVTMRVMGEPLTRLRQNELDASLGADLAQRAKAAARLYRYDEQSAFCFNAFEEFVARCRARDRRVVVCCGQLNPILAHELDSGLRPRMLNFFDHLASKYDNVILLGDGDLPAQTEKDYEDLVHANAAARVRFTDALGNKLRDLSFRMHHMIL